MEQEVFSRLNALEQNVHTLNFRMESIEDDNLGNRVLTLEGSVAQISKNVEKMESTAACIRDDVATMKTWSKVVAAILSASAVAIGLLISLGEFLK